MQPATSADVVIFGGGVAGLWTLYRLRRQGYQAILLESARLGEGQTRYAQGIIHGGTKYALTGKLTASAEAVGQMPGIWRACLQGEGEIDLRGVQVLSQHHYMWSTSNLTSRLSGFFASHVMKSRTRALDRQERPVVFQHKDFRGQVYQLDEVVLDTASVVHALAEPQRAAIFRYSPDTLSILMNADSATLRWQQGGQDYALQARQIVLCAGQGNAQLLQQLGLTQPQMQTRPLHMVMLRGMHDALYAHCLGASTVPRITVTSHPDTEQGWVWYLGGQLAEEGVARDAPQQIDAARAEMTALFPWLDFSGVQWTTLRIDRAEPQQADGKRPDTAFVQQQGCVITTWPTKLALAPLLAAQVSERLTQSGMQPGPTEVLNLGEFPGYAPLPWQEEQRWS